MGRIQPESAAPDKPHADFAAIEAGDRLISAARDTVLRVRSRDGDHLVTIIEKGGVGLRNLEGSKYFVLQSTIARFGFTVLVLPCQK